MKIATKDDWNIKEMPEKRDIFTLEREFTEEQIVALRRGNIPQEMEDKWFWYMEGDTLYAHRSWTGICVYTVEFAIQENPDSRIELGGYPFIDVYANFQLKRARFFIAMSHINAGSGSKMQFLTPHYPMNNRTFRMGVSWTFIN